MNRIFGLFIPKIPLFSPYFTISHEYIQCSSLTISSCFALFCLAFECFRSDTNYTQWYRGELVAVENVPAEVCENCNEEYFSPETVDKLQIAIELHRSYKTIQVPVFQLL
jgi:YgiT-type zinc finger domain-containing protein